MGVAIVLPGPADFAAWRNAARGLVAAGITPEQAEWRVTGEGAGLFAEAPPPNATPVAAFRVPRAFLELAEIAIRHRDAERFALLYRALWRVTHGEAALMQVATDPDVVRLTAMAKAVRRDAHKMHAFLRFREVETEAGLRHVAWFEPEHHIEEAEAGFFVRRFAGLRWSIVTPRRSVHWDGQEIAFGPGGRRADVPPDDAMEPLWRAYYAAIFNPARLKPGAMRAEMPRKYWRNMPETAEIPRLLAEAPKRVAEMIARGGAAPNPRPQRMRDAAPGGGAPGAPAVPPASDPAGVPRASDPAGVPRASDPAGVPRASDPAGVPRDADPARVPRASDRARVPRASDRARVPRDADPAGASGVAAGMDLLDARADPAGALAALRRELAARHDLPDFARRATQPVFGEGPVGARLLFVGEQPGDEEDIQGRPFVGPAGRLFDRALAEAGVPREEAYVTNAVKHFKYEPRGRRRLHQSPDAGDIAFYRPFLLREVALVGPRLLVALGATALRGLTGKAMPVMKTRGTVIEGPEGLPLFATVHPSYLLRVPDQDAQSREYARFVEDLRTAAARR